MSINDKFKKFQQAPKGDLSYEEPTSSTPSKYIPKPSVTVETETPEVTGGNILKQNGYLLSQLTGLKREVVELKEDIATLFCMLMNYDVPTDLTKEDLNEIYMSFKKDDRHLINKKKKNNETN